MKGSDELLVKVGFRGVGAWSTTLFGEDCMLETFAQTMDSLGKTRGDGADTRSDEYDLKIRSHETFSIRDGESLMSGITEVGNLAQSSWSLSIPDRWRMLA